jgi:hypothetical protein
MKRLINKIKNFFTLDIGLHGGGSIEEELNK